MMMNRMDSRREDVVVVVIVAMHLLVWENRIVIVATIVARLHDQYIYIVIFDFENAVVAIVAMHLVVQ